MSIANSSELQEPETDFLTLSEEVTSEDVAADSEDLGSGGAIVAKHLANPGRVSRVQARFTLNDDHTAESIREVLARLKQRGISVTDPNPDVLEQGEADVYVKDGHEILALDGSYYHVQLAIHELARAGIQTALSMESRID